MIYLTLLISTLLTFISCGPNNYTEESMLSETQSIKSSDELNYYVDKFKEYSVKRGRHIDMSGIVIGFTSKTLTSNAYSQGTIGRCYTASKVIVINKDKWSELSNIEKESVVIHELGHCAMGLKHNEGHDVNQWPISIMYPSVDISYYYEQNKDVYLDRLFE